jgi:hypothetical protein
MPNKLTNFSMQFTDSKGTNWCWAAVAASISASLGGSTGLSGGPWQQCEIASSVLNQLSQPTCCDDPSTDACNVGAPLEDALRCVGHMAPGATVLGADVGFGYIQGQIDAQLPVPVRIGWQPDPVDLGHYVCLIGYDETKQTVDVADPQSGPGSKSYGFDEFANAYRDGAGQWTNTYPIT